MKKISSIELLRFISSFMILIWHYQQFYLPYNSFSEVELFLNNKAIQPFYSFLSLFYIYGDFGVDIFFAISGYVFSYVYLQNIKKTNFKVFFLNRFARLYPLHFLTLIIILCLQIYSFDHYDFFLIHQFNDLYHFILNLFFISGWGFQIGPSFNGPIWSVSVEIIIYLVFFFCILRVDRNRFIYSLLILLIFISFKKFPIIDNFLIQINFENQIINCGTLFFEGVIVHFIFKKFNNSLSLITGLLLLTLSMIGNFKLYIFAPGVLLFFLCFEQYLSNRIKIYFNFFGNLTYGLYLWHLPVQIFLIILMKTNNINFHVIQNNSFFILYLVLVFLISIVSFFFFEKKIRDKIKFFYLNA
jgi:peptidoglycan/LPS O-acetylase OafA/YrhL